MSIKVALDNRPEFYTNLDFISGRVILGLPRPEQIGSIVVKLEGESITAVQVQQQLDRMPGSYRNTEAVQNGGLATENHKILYKLQQVFPDEYHATSSNPYGAFPLQPGEHVFPFKFKMPINNVCSDQAAMSKIGGLSGAGGFGAGGGLFGIGGVRVMDGTKQLSLRHITGTLPPSLTGFPMEAEIRYYIKVTVQRPGFLKENWRYHIGLKFLPIELPRPKVTGQEAFARRPFNFKPRPAQQERKLSSFFGKKGDKEKAKLAAEENQQSDDAKSPGGPSADPNEVAKAPSIEMSARLPHPSILTCNQSVPLRLIAKKLNNCPEQVNLISFQMDLIGYTNIRASNQVKQKVNRWTIVSGVDLNIPLTASTKDDAGTELVVPDVLWKRQHLPNTVAPSFQTCNLSRKYELELKLGLSWGKTKMSAVPAQTIYLPLSFKNISVYSGIAPPAALLNAIQNRRRPSKSNGAATTPATPTTPTDGRPNLPPRRQQSRPSAAGPAQMPTQPPISDPLYPPQLVPGQEAPPYDDAPPSYDEAMAENIAPPFDSSQPRPAYSGVTNEDGPSLMPTEKN